MKNLINLSRTLSRVKRFQVYNLFNQYNVAEHSFRVAILAYAIMPKDDDKVNKYNVLAKALFHDLEEALLGDFPGPLKKKMPSFNKEYDKLAEAVMIEQLKGDDLYFWSMAKQNESGQIIYLADNLEAFQTVVEEVEAGNKSMNIVLRRFVDGINKIYPEKLLTKYENAASILSDLKNRSLTILEKENI